MPDINNLLGNKPTQEESSSTPEPNNPLIKLNEASKEKVQEKKTSSDKKLDKDSVIEMLMTGDNNNGMFKPSLNKEENENLHEDINEKAKVTVKDNVTPKGKYIKEFKNDLLKNPDDYKVMTPKGEMTVAEAVKKGYNPITKRFEKSHSQEEIKKKHLEGLNPADKARLEEFTNLSSAKVAKKDAAKYKLKEDSPMIQAEDTSTEQMQQETPTQINADPGAIGLPPTSEESPEGIQQLLGGQ